MSYPRFIQPLIIEDEPDVKKSYDGIFRNLANSYPIAECCYAFSYEQAEEQLRMDRIYHLIVLDLKLPRTLGVPPVEGLDLGEALLGQCIARDDYPVPALLIISGHVDRADQEKLRTATSANFAYGRVLVKSSTLDGEIERAVQAALEYNAIGIHIRDSGDRRFPTLSPREEDLLRRVLITRQGAIGVDVDWWSADSIRTPPAPDPEWTKVLMGRILLKSDRPSRINFYKFMPAANGLAAIEAAQRLEQKLPHIKLNGHISSTTSALIVTEKVGKSDTRPIPLYDFLRRDRRTKPAIARVSRQIIEQLAALGDQRPQSQPLSGLLWNHHSTERIVAAWESFAPVSLPESLASCSGPIDVYSRLCENGDTVFFTEQTFLHGDLHLGNVALDVMNDETDAFIFDAGGTAPTINVRDVATLEVSALLHQEFDSTTFTSLCERLYMHGTFLPEDASFADSAVQNTYNLIQQLRGSIDSKGVAEFYALMLFDYALVQLGGLTFGISRGKVFEPRHAALLAMFSAAWYEEFTRVDNVRGKESSADS